MVKGEGRCPQGPSQGPQSGPPLTYLLGQKSPRGADTVLFCCRQGRAQRRGGGERGACSHFDTCGTPRTNICGRQSTSPKASGLKTGFRVHKMPTGHRSIQALNKSPKASCVARDKWFPFLSILSGGSGKVRGLAWIFGLWAL